MEESLISNNEDSTSRNEELDDTEQTCCYTCCNPRGKSHRFVALFFMCFLSFGSYFCYDNPGALEDNFLKDLNITTTKYSLFYSLYSWPTVVLCFIGGYLIDSVFGIRLGANIYVTITLFGQILFASGALFNTFWLMAMGRFFFGMGAEPLAVAQNSYAVLWFKGKELNMVFGLVLSLARFGSAINFWVMQPIYEWVNKTYQGYECLGIVLFIASFTCIFSLLFSVILGCIDKRADSVLNRSQNQNSEIIKFRDILRFDVTFWLVSIVCVTYYVSVFPFISLGKDFFMKKFKMDSEAANIVNSLVYLVSAFASPILGFLVDKTGKNVFWVVVSVVLTTAAHFLLAFTALNPYVSMIFMGLAYSMLASGLWPLVALIVPQNQLGTAYGLCQSVQNLGLALANYIAGNIVDHAGYFWSEIYFITNLCVSLMITLVVWIVDSKKGGMLNMTPANREAYNQNRLEAERDEEEKLIADGSSSVQTSSDFEVRNRYLSRIGAPLDN
ncbi:major facilitator superfamily domain-containing protein 1 isoform X2 [Agrilus planipennis]|uniref:Lysosomal dipeptide transporter MFSD1 n=1 Tax=Agrilus planipennis TaxID=224129 RepID=A0A7F5R9V0_AGRPL|nr:major facilitator superfamily domain-containing protein 1 isoform X2 [Agrilus planipennis]